MTHRVYDTGEARGAPDFNNRAQGGSTATNFNRKELLRSLEAKDPDHNAEDVIVHSACHNQAARSPSDDGQPDKQLQAVMEARGLKMVRPTQFGQVVHRALKPRGSDRDDNRMMDALNRIVEESGMEHTATQNQHAPTKRLEEMRHDSGALGQSPSQDRPQQAHVAGGEETAREEGVVGSHQARLDKGASEEVSRSRSPSMRLEPASESRQLLVPRGCASHLWGNVALWATCWW